MRPTVSWIMPVKNGMPFLTKTLDSLAAQTYRDFEVVVWDNDSTDGTTEELKRWIPSRLPGRVITGQPLSLGGSLRALVELVDTEFCARIDADDVCQPDRLEKQVNFLLAHPEIALVGSNLNIIDENSILTGGTINYLTAHDDIVCDFLIRNPIGHPSVLCRRSALLAAGNYDANAILEDYDLWLRMARHHKLANLPAYLVKYRIHSLSYTRQIVKAKTMELHMEQVITKHLTPLFGLNPSEAERLCERLDSLSIARALKMARHLSRTQGGSTWKRMRNASFIGYFRSKTRCRDLVSRFGFALLDRECSSIKRELQQFKGEVRNGLLNRIMKLPLGDHLVRTMRARNARRRFESWLHQQNSSGHLIDRRIDFIGRPDGYTYLRVHSGVEIQRDSTIWISFDADAEPELILGERSYIARNTFLGVFKPIHIGKRSLIGAYCYLISGNHKIERRDIPISEQGFVGAPIVIEDDAWLGTHVVVMPGVTIGRGAVVGAGSVVTRDIPAWEIWGGVPARFIKSRPE